MEHSYLSTETQLKGIRRHPFTACMSQGDSEPQPTCTYMQPTCTSIAGELLKKVNFQDPTLGQDLGVEEVSFCHKSSRPICNMSRCERHHVKVKVKLATCPAGWRTFSVYSRVPHSGTKNLSCVPKATFFYYSMYPLLEFPFPFSNPFVLWITLWYCSACSIHFPLSLQSVQRMTGSP